MLLYAIAIWATWRLLRDWNELHTQAARYEHWFWRTLFMGLVLLGINKQLDLQSAFTEIGRMMAEKQGWYSDRRQLQMAFVAGFTIMGLTLFAATLHLTWGAPSQTFWALVGGAGLASFVIIRAASFHHIDAALGHKISGLRINWLLEIGGLLIIIHSAHLRRKLHR